MWGGTGCGRGGVEEISSMSSRQISTSSSEQDVSKLVRACLLKACQVIIQSRVVFAADAKPVHRLCSHNSSSANLFARSISFNLEMTEIVSVKNACKDILGRNPHAEIFLDVLLQIDSQEEKEDTILLERWILHYEPHAYKHHHVQNKVYMRTVVMLRSLFSLVRLLPAHQLHKLSLQESNDNKIRLRYTLSNARDDTLVFRESTGSFVFPAVQTSEGKFHLSVIYQKECEQWIRKIQDTPVGIEIDDSFEKIPQFSESKAPSITPKILSSPEIKPLRLSRTPPIIIARKPFAEVQNSAQTTRPSHGNSPSNYSFLSNSPSLKLNGTEPLNTSSSSSKSLPFEPNRYIKQQIAHQVCVFRTCKSQASYKLENSVTSDEDLNPFAIDSEIPKSDDCVLPAILMSCRNSPSLKSLNADKSTVKASELLKELDAVCSSIHQTLNGTT